MIAFTLPMISFLPRNTGAWENPPDLGATTLAQHDAAESPTVPDTCIRLSENFDGVIAPALPPGWSGQWITSTVMPDSPPNCAFADDPPSIGIKELLSPLISVTSTSAQLRFRNFYNTEAGFDGGVLEVSISGGPFQDILSAGGTFASGGYNSTLSTGFASPFPGRQAWSGNSGGYINTLVNLPPSANGQGIRLHWRMGSDNAVGGVGWRIDNVVITHPGCAPTVLSTVSRKTHGIAGDFDIPLAPTGTIGGNAAEVAARPSIATKLSLPLPIQLRLVE